jgi:hypothetical protein
LDRVEIELADHGGRDNAKLPVTYDDFERYGIHRHAVGPAIRETVALGFLVVTEVGRAGNADWRKPNLFRLTYRDTNYGPTNEWEKIETDEHADALARAARAALPRKTKSQWRRTPNVSGENRHRKRQMHGAETTTTAHGAESTTTLDISGRNGDILVVHPATTTDADRDQYLQDHSDLSKRTASTAPSGQQSGGRS